MKNGYNTKEKQKNAKGKPTNMQGETQEQRRNNEGTILEKRRETTGTTEGNMMEQHMNKQENNK